MFALKVNDTYIDLPASFSIAFELNNHCMLEEVDLGDFSFPFTVDATPVNLQAFGLVNQIQTETITRRHDGCEIHLSNNFWKKATVIIDRITNTKISGYIKLDFFSLSTLSKKLKDIDYEGEQLIGANTDDVVAFANAQNATGVQVCFPCVHNPDFYGSANPDFLGIVNRFDIANNTLRKNATLSTDCLVPMPYIKFLLEKIARDANIFCDGTFWNDSKQDKAWLWNNRALDRRAGSSFVRASFLADTNYVGSIYVQWPDDSTAPNSDTSNLYNPATSYYTCPSDGTYIMSCVIKFEGNNNPPRPAIVSITYFKNASTMQTFSFTQTSPGQSTFTPPPVSFPCLTGNTLTFAVDVYYPPDPDTNTADYNIMAGSFMMVFNANEGSINDYALTMDIANHVPDWTVSKFLWELKKTFFLRITIDPNSQKLVLDYTKDRIAATPKYLTGKEIPGFQSEPADKIKSYGYEFSQGDDWASDNFKDTTLPVYNGYYDSFNDLPSAGLGIKNQIAFVENENRYYICSENDSGNFEWVHYSDNYYPIVVDNNGTKDLRSNLPPMFMSHVFRTVIGGGSFDFIPIPTIKQKGSSVAWVEMGLNPSEPRICYFKSITIEGASYPYSSSINRDPELTSINGIDMMISVMNNTFWDEWLAIINSDVYIKYIDPTILDLYSFDTDTPVFMSNLLWSIKKARFQLRGKTLEPLQLELFRHG